MTGAGRAREAAGVSLAEAAALLGVKPGSLRRMEREGFPYHHMERLARRYGADWRQFLPCRATGGAKGRGVAPFSSPPRAREAKERKRC